MRRYRPPATTAWPLRCRACWVWLVASLALCMWLSVMLYGALQQDAADQAEVQRQWEEQRRAARLRLERLRREKAQREAAERLRQKRLEQARASRAAVAAAVNAARVNVTLATVPVLTNPAIVVLAYNRPRYLERTLASLLSLRGLQRYAVYVSQDGYHEEVANVIAALGERVHHLQHPRPGGHMEGQRYLALHYKWALDSILLERGHSSVIIVEDDMEFSPDFLAYFEGVGPLLDTDHSLVCVSSWNDNAFGRFRLRSHGLLRTSFFPGLGWMLSQRLWAHELSPSFPTAQWDHWLRANMGQRHCIIPEVSRNHNFGQYGANMDRDTYARYFASARWYHDGPPEDHGDDEDGNAGGADGGTLELWDTSLVASSSAYDDHIRSLIASATFVTSLTQVTAPGRGSHGPFLLTYHSLVQWKALAKTLGIWSPPRGHYRHATVLRLAKNGAILVLAHARLCPLLPTELRVQPNAGLRVIRADRGQSCATACSLREPAMRCSRTEFDTVNNCEALQRELECPQGCSKQWGPDIPNAVFEGDYKGWCLMTEEAPKCDGAHQDTMRLCPCVP